MNSGIFSDGPRHITVLPNGRRGGASRWIGAYSPIVSYANHAEAYVAGTAHSSRTFHGTHMDAALAAAAAVDKARTGWGRR